MEDGYDDTSVAAIEYDFIADYSVSIIRNGFVKVPRIGINSPRLDFMMISPINSFWF